MLRLFNRGHIEEARFIAMLLTIGMPVYQQDAEGKQFRIHFGEIGITAWIWGPTLHIIIMPQLWLELRITTMRSLHWTSWDSRGIDLLVQLLESLQRQRLVQDHAIAQDPLCPSSTLHA